MATGLGILILNDVGQSVVYNIWSFFRPFNWNVWVAVLLTAAFLPLFTWLVENLYLTGSIPCGPWSMPALQRSVFKSFNQLFILDYQEVRAWPTQIIMTCYNFMIMVLICSYTANLAAELSAAQLISNATYTSVSDLQGTRVLTSALYAPRLAALSRLDAEVTDRWNGSVSFLNIVEKLQTKTISAFIYDKQLLIYYMDLYYDTLQCTLKFLGDTGSVIHPFDYGFAFHPNFPEALFHEFNINLIQAQAVDELLLLQDLYLPDISSSPAGTCNNTGSTESPQFTFTMVR